MQDTSTPLDVCLVSDFLKPVFQVMAGVAVLGSPHDDPRRVCKEVIHLLERSAGSLGQKEPEKEGIGKVADDEDKIESIATVVGSAVSKAFGR